MHNIEVYEESSLIKAIINLAVLDAFNYKNPEKPKPFIYSKGTKKKSKYSEFVSQNSEYLSWEARRFLNKDNWLFCYYCNLISIDPEYFSEKIHKRIKEFDINDDCDLKGVDFLNVNTL